MDHPEICSHEMNKISNSRMKQIENQIHFEEVEEHQGLIDPKVIFLHQIRF